MQQSGRRAERVNRSMRFFGLLFFAVMMNFHDSDHAAYGQQPFSAGGWSGGRHAQPFDPELFSDYLLSDQTPHPAVARIIAPESTGVSLGSGVLVDINGSQGLVLTNWHVIRDSRSAVLVQFADGFQSAGTVIRFDEAWDLAAISIWKPKANPVPLAQRNPIPGEPLSIAGYGRGAYREQRGRCTEYLSPGSGYPKELVELQAPARQGDSGGPILNTDGRLAGVLFGEGNGRTVGSCASRLRVFLASVGSDGFEATPSSVAADTTHQIQKQPMQSTERAMPPVQAFSRSPRMYPTAVSSPVQPMPQTVAMPYQSISQQSISQQPAAPWSLLGDFQMSDAVKAHFNIFTNTKALLTAVAGMSLVLFGLRLIVRSRQQVS